MTAKEKYLLLHPERRLETCRKYRENNLEKVRAAARKWSREHREQLIEYGKQYRREHVCKEREYRRVYASRRIKDDVNYRLRHYIRTRIRRAVKTIRRSYRSEQLIGCTINELRQHLYSLFKPGMSWSNHGVNGWHIDHITPCASFDLSDPEQQKKCFNFRNLQPLWAYDNFKKRDRLCTPM